MTFTPAMLPDAEKEALCQGLLDEFGVGRVRVTSKGEMIHGCLLPGGQHSDQQRNPTASLNYKKLTYKCLGCNQSGGLLWFIGIMRGTSAAQARKWLSKETGTEGQVQELAKLLSLFDALYAGESVKAVIPKMSPNLLTPWLKIHPYMTEERGIPEETLIHFMVGYGEIQIGPPEDHVMSHRIVFPLFWKGDLVGWQTRRIFNDGTPKYHFSPDFPRDRALYNYNPRRKRAIVVESQMSTLKHFHGIPEIVATFGASVSDEQIRYLRTFPEIVLCMDNGKGGWDAVQGIYDNRKRLVRPGLGEALAPYSNVFVYENTYMAGRDEEGRPIWLDPADFTTDIMSDLVDRAVPYPLWRPPDNSELREYSQPLTTTGA
jgi:hypothetical protein